MGTVFLLLYSKWQLCFKPILAPLLISLYGVFFAAIVGIPLGIFIARRRKMAKWVLGVANVIQTVPSLAMLSILMLGLGLGVNTVIVTVFLYSLLPIVANTYTWHDSSGPDYFRRRKRNGDDPFSTAYASRVSSFFSLLSWRYS